MAGAQAFLEGLATAQCRLTVFKVEGGSVVDTAAVLRCLGEHEGLRHVCIQAEEAQRPLSLHILAPIRVCSALEFLELHVGGPFEMTDGDMEMLVSGLPQLRNLILHASLAHDATLTINTLRIITTSCCLIEEIKISSLDVSNPNPNPVFEASSMLCLLEVGRSRIQDTTTVPLFLDMLSDVDTFNVTCSTWGEQRHLWSEVAELIPVLRKARYNERARLRASSCV